MDALKFRSGRDELYAVIDGTGPALVYYHGLFGTHEQAYSQLQSLVGEYTLVTPDIRGRGRSVCPHRGCHTWQQYAADVVRLLDHLDIERAVVGGASFGAGVSVAAALRHPDRFDAVLLRAPVFLGNEIGFLRKQRESATFDEWRHLSQISEPGWFRSMIDAHVAGMESPVAADAERRKWSSHDPASFAAVWKGVVLPKLNGERCHPFDDLSQLSSLDMPVLILPGSDDLHAREVSEAYAARFPNAALVEMTEDGGGSPAGSKRLREVDDGAPPERRGSELTVTVRDFLTKAVSNGAPGTGHE